MHRCKQSCCLQIAAPIIGNAKVNTQKPKEFCKRLKDNLGMENFEKYCGEKEVTSLLNARHDRHRINFTLD